METYAWRSECLICLKWETESNALSKLRKDNYGKISEIQTVFTVQQFSTSLITWNTFASGRRPPNCLLNWIQYIIKINKPQSQQLSEIQIVHCPLFLHNVTHLKYHYLGESVHL